MPRAARNTANTGVYHAILRGVNRQQIFECSDDYNRFLEILKEQTLAHTEYGRTIPPRCTIYSYCLMGNHVHLLLQERSDTIGEVMKRIASSYVFYYNHKYNRLGHLFQERFKSQPCDDIDYYITLLRYIHQNPIKAGLSTDPTQYPWSSWHEFTGKAQDGFCNIQATIRRYPFQDLDYLVRQILTDDEADGLLDIETAPDHSYQTNEDIWQFLTLISGATNPTEFQAIPRPQQKHYLWQAHDQGIGPRTLSRITGVPYSIVQRATSAAKEKFQQNGMVCDESPDEELWYTYCDEDDFKENPEY